MKWHEQHEAFKELVIRKGISRIEELNQALPLGYSVPARRLDKWIAQLLSVPSRFSTQRRYVNHFQIGADPEFIFMIQGHRQDASNFNLHQGLAFGMDNNGRLIEVRPHPSRSALVVTASILSTLRWLRYLHPETLQYDWQSGVFLGGDGLGGHVHFGRKRPNRQAEIKALDCLSEQILAARMYDAREVECRRRGDEHNQRYGLPGDFRHQVHGYEYRTFPSWLDSPELAFVILTLSKLAVHNPKLFPGCEALVLDRSYQRIRNILSYYKDMDDDARLALLVISRQFPVHKGGDFKARWGINNNLRLEVPKISFIPTSIKPSVDEIGETFSYLAEGKPLSNTVPTPNWEPLLPPAGYAMALAATNTRGAKGLGELIWDVVQPESQQYAFVNSRGGTRGFFAIPRQLADSLPRGWQQTCGGKVGITGERYIMSEESKRDPVHFAEHRRLLLETVFPFWRITDVKPDSYKQWQANLRATPVKRFYDQVLFGEVRHLPSPVR